MSKSKKVILKTKKVKTKGQKGKETLLETAVAEPVTIAGNGKTGLYVSNDGSQLAKDVPRKRKGRSPQMERQFLHFQQPS